MMMASHDDGIARPSLPPRCPCQHTTPAQQPTSLRQCHRQSTRRPPASQCACLPPSLVAGCDASPWPATGRFGSAAAAAASSPHAPRFFCMCSSCPTIIHVAARPGGARGTRGTKAAAPGQCLGEGVASGVRAPQPHFHVQRGAGAVWSLRVHSPCRPCVSFVARLRCRRRRPRAAGRARKDPACPGRVAADTGGTRRVAV